MPALERRVQMLIDHDRYRRLEVEAQRSGQSVAAMIRLAVDRLLESGSSVRASAAASLLHDVNDPTEPRVEWSEVKEAMESALVSKLP